MKFLPYNDIKMKEKKLYERPLSEVLDVFPERVLCQSPTVCNSDPEDMDLQQGAW